MDRSNVGIEDYSEIKKHLDFMRLCEHANSNRLCYSRVEGLRGDTAICWCRKAGPNGTHLPCPTAE